MNISNVYQELMIINNKYLSEYQQRYQQWISVMNISSEDNNNNLEMSAEALTPVTYKMPLCQSSTATYTQLETSGGTMALSGGHWERHWHYIVALVLCDTTLWLALCYGTVCYCSILLVPTINILPRQFCSSIQPEGRAQISQNIEYIAFMVIMVYSSW